jgi:hypothetical protein
MTRKIQTNLRLTVEARELLRRLSASLGISKGDVVELLAREAAGSRSISARVGTKRKGK